MLLPLSWLQDYIDLPESVEELRDLLTYSGLEVEAVESHGSEFEGLIVAKITDISPHPNADKLTICTVALNEEESIEVVCGAPNVRKGLNTIYAPVGSVLPTGLKLKKAKIRGVESLGMLCAEDELGLSGDHKGIMELSDTLLPGTPAVEVLGGPEIVFDLEVTPNRPDCLSIIGVARELAAVTGRSFRLPEIRLPDLPKDGTTIEVDLQDSESCPRYTAQLLGGAKVGPSPDWMQQRLRLCGLRPINNLVDITNYVMLETGQPLHAFDRTLLKGNTIIIREAGGNSSMKTLDGEDQKLSPSDVVIADETTPLALAGIMGGANSDIQDSTESVLLETAAFSPSQVRATAKRLNLHTDSSYRFARGSDMYGCEWVSQRATSLICEHAGAKLLGPLKDVWPGKKDLRILSCTWQKICDLIGIEIESRTMLGFFERLDLKVLESSDEGCTLEIPGFRSDLTRAVDLVEEIARLYGLDKIPIRAPQARIVPNAKDFEIRLFMRIGTHLASRGFLEALNYSLTSAAVLKKLDSENVDRQVILPNPISQDQGVLRTSLLPQMIETLSFNKARQNDEIALFESGKTYLQLKDGVEEHQHISFGTIGPWRRSHLDKQGSVSDREAYTDLKGEMEALLQVLRCADKVRFAEADFAAFTPGQSAVMLCGETLVGRIGLLNKALKESYKLSGPVALAEVNLDLVMPERRLHPTMQAIPTFPSISRDVALILDRSKTHHRVMELVNHQRPKELIHVSLFDLFESDKLGENKKSMAYRFVYQNTKKTLTDKSVEKMHGRIVDRLMSELNAEIVGKE